MGRLASSPPRCGAALVQVAVSQLPPPATGCQSPRNPPLPWALAAGRWLIATDPDPNVVIQAMLTLNLHKVAGASALIEQTASASSVRGIKEIGTQIIKGGNSLGQRPSLADTGAAGVNLTVDQRRAIQRGESTYKELCFSCHGADGQGAPMQGAPAGSTLAPRRPR